MNDKQDLIKSETISMLKLLDNKADVTVEPSETGFQVFIEGDENALLIGKHGNTLSSLELILSLIIAKKLGEFTRLTLEIGNYRKEREDYLKELVEKLKQDVVATGFEKSIRGLKSWERRFIHLYLKDDSEVMTESEGEGRDRVLLIKKK